MTTASSFGITIGGVKHLVSAINLASDQTIATGPKRTHRIMVLDWSGSMSWHLDQLSDQVRSAVKAMPKEDLVSVAWFSGPTQNGQIVVGATPGEDLDKLLRNFRPVGSTCFSEVLGSVVDMVTRFSGLVDQTVIDMFTDGQPVVPWGSLDEKTRAASAVQTLVENGVIAFNTIGYGPYYNREFLNDLSSISEHGVLTHANNIDSFLATITHNMEVSRNFVKRTAEVHSVQGSDIVYLSPGKSSRMTTNQISLSALDADANYIFVAAPEADIKGKFVTVNEESFEVGKAESVDDETKQNFLYAYAAEAFKKGDHLKAVDILVNNLRDKALATAAFNAFTTTEIGEAQNLINEAVHDVTKRYADGKTGPGFMPAKDALCVMDVFTTLINGDQTAYYVPFGKGTDKYERIGRTATDNENRFTPDTEEEVRAPVDELVWNKEKLNLSLRFTRKGKVKLNPRAADNVNLPHEVDSYIWRNHTFVKDGNVNVKRAEFLLPLDMFNALKEKGVKLDSTGEPVEVNPGSNNPVPYVRAVINFAKLPIINRTYIDQGNDPLQLHAATTKIVRTEAATKVVRALIEKVMDSSANMAKTGAYQGYNAEQIRVLEEHGVRNDGSYGGVDVEVAKAEDSDSYEARVINFTLKGASNLPSIEEMLEMKAGKTNPVVDEKGVVVKQSKPKATNLPGSYMIEAWDKLNAAITAQGFDLEKPTVALRDYLKDQLRALNSQLRAERNVLNMLKLAKTLTGDGFKGIEINTKGEYEFAPADNLKEVMLIKVNRKPVYIDAVA